MKPEDGTWKARCSAALRLKWRCARCAGARGMGKAWLASSDRSASDRLPTPNLCRGTVRAEADLYKKVIVVLQRAATYK